MNEFDFDLSDDNILPDSNIVVQGKIEIKQKQTKQINRITDLTLDDKIQINNLLWYTKMKDEPLKQYLMTEFGLKDIIAENLTYLHHQNYKKDPGFYSIFEKNSILVTNQKSAEMAVRHEIRKAANKRKPLYFKR